ncbi:lantibiotic dehydratase [Dyadobacter sp. 3J3]|uniref:lantibiotic dehydratase n=1 Tax=Dyadobacter sp. 3J3 TaxID=2606600 RepID=UPI001359EF67|nr:lantibiotic dehydratase [Dyadobacter sp. 3J3]
MKPQDFFVVRRPLLCLDFFFSFQKAVGNDPTAFESYLKLIYSDPLLQHALHLASPALYQQVQRLVNGELQNGKKHLLKTLYKYLIRMSTRCTPFGLFAGYSLGVLAENTTIRFEGENSLALHTKVDADICWQLVNQILKSPQVVSQLKFFPNTSLYKIMDSYRYIERGADGKTLGLSAIKTNPYLANVLEHAKDGRTMAELIQILLQSNLGKKTAKTFIDSLIESQFLVSSFEMNATGENYLERVKNQLKNMTGSKQHLATIVKIQSLAKSSSGPVLVQQALKTEFERAGVKSPEKSFLQTDLAFRTSCCEISRDTVHMLSSEIQELTFLSNKAENPDLTEFASRLFSHFGNKSVPLLPVLDPASGIGYGMLEPSVMSSLTLLTGLAEPGYKEVGNKSDTLLCRLKKKILEKTRQTGCIAYDISPMDIAAFENELPTPLPESFYIFGSVVSSTESDFDTGEFIFDLKAVAGPSALNLMSRFAQSDPYLADQLVNAARLEEAQNPDVIFAEICHVPDASVLKVISRPSLRSYEIPYLSHSSLPQANQILPGELLVSSPDGKEIILSCTRVDKRIIPRLTSAHYYANGLPFYRFLCELAQQSDSASMGWDWSEFSAEPMLPRVSYKHLILQKATWHLESDEFETVMGKSDDQLKSWAAFASKKKLPRYFQIQQGDNELLIDGQSLFSLQLLEDSLKKNSWLTLTEYLEKEGQGFPSEKSSSLANEVIIPFLNPRPKLGQKGPDNIQTTPAVFHMGSEWLYVKLYCSGQAADFLLTEIIAPFCEALHGKDELNKWFFIRYYDPKPHLRVRFNVNEGKMSWSRLLEAFQNKVQPYLENGLISAFTTDQYVRETDRYNLLPYDKTETIFFVDSYLVCSSLGLLSEHKDPDLRWLLALRGCETLLNGAGLTVLEKFVLVKRLHSDFSQEFHAGIDEITLLDQKYRTQKKMIISFLDPEADHMNAITSFTKNFDSLSACIKLALSSTNILPGEQLIETAAHVMHLFLNRWFNDMHRKQEWIMYHFLKKYYDMVLNLKKMAKKDQSHFISNR